MPRPPARIVCLDLDTFFVSVQRLYDPELVGRPVIVGPTGRHGVVLSASYEARPFGVRSGMPVSQARRLAPHAIFVSGRHGDYSSWAKKVKAILERYTPEVRTASIDEFYLDFAGCERLYRGPEDASDTDGIRRAVWRMRDQIQEELGLPSSAGIGASRRIAKMASGLAKPAGVFLVRAGEERAFVQDLPVRKFPGIGPRAEERLTEAGIDTLGELLDLPAGPLRARFGKLARSVERAVRPEGTATLGRERPAFREHDPHGVDVGSISNERTFFEPLGDVQIVEDKLRALVERVCWRARKRGAQGRTVTLKLRYADFDTITRSKTLPLTADEVRVWHCVRDLLHRHRDPQRRVRLIGVGLSRLELGSAQQELPFGAQRPEVGKAIDAVRSRFGFDAISVAGG